MTDLAGREWRLIREETRRGPMQMALDEIAAETVAAGGPRTIRVYQWEPSTLSLGYHQDPETIDWAYCEREGITVIRRPTGGGAIYHDTHGDISYSIIAPTADLPGKVLDAYERLCEPILTAFERMGVDAGFATDQQPAIHEPACYLRQLHPAHDVVADGHKISGNAQYRQRESVIQHGSLTYDTQPTRHCAVFADDTLSPERFENRVTSIHDQSDCSRSDAVAILAATLQRWADAEPGTWTDDELARARERAKHKYESTAWTQDRTEPV